MLATPILTDIDDKSKIYLAGSPVHFNIQNEATDANIQSVTVEVYIWRGYQTADLPATPSIRFLDIPKISPDDNYISISLHNEIKAYITSSNLNKNNPQWAYNTTQAPTTVGEGCYFHIVYKVDAESDKQLGTFFATTGYRYNFEQKGGGYTTYEDSETYRYYAPGINYAAYDFDLTTVAATSHSGRGGMIWENVITPSTTQVQTGMKTLIAYVNRLGLWDVMTPFGKVLETIETKRDEFASTFRDPLNVNAQIQHLKQTGAPKGFRKFAINTGLLDERNTYQIRELLASSKIYLVIFSEATFTAPNIGITIDSTDVTIDDTTITIDTDVVGAGDVGKYKTFVQIPVKTNTQSFVKKTQLNDKSSISYTIELEETNNFINDIQ
jgi:hypothetical protein